MIFRELLQNQNTKQDLRKEIYLFIQRFGPVSKNEILNKFDLPHTTLTRIIDFLHEQGFIFEAGHGHTTGGRPPIMYNSDPSSGYYLGLELSRTHVKIVLLNANFVLITENSFLLDESYTPEKTVNKIVKTTRDILVLNGIEYQNIVGMGVGSVGPLDREKGIIISPEGFLAEGWKDVHIVSMLKSHFDFWIHLSNGVDSAALAESYEGACREEKLLYCINGYGIRCSLINQGEIYNRKPGDATSYSHIKIALNGRICECGNDGCVNAYSSLGAIMQLINERSQANEISNTNDLLNELYKRNPIVEEVVLESAEYYAIALSNIVNSMHPEVIILHGKLIYNYQEYFEKVKEVLKEKKYPIDRSLRIFKGSLGEEATAIGAAMEVLQR